MLGDSVGLPKCGGVWGSAHESAKSTQPARWVRKEWHGFCILLAQTTQHAVQSAVLPGARVPCHGRWCEYTENLCSEPVSFRVGAHPSHESNRKWHISNTQESTEANSTRCVGTVFKDPPAAPVSSS